MTDFKDCDKTFPSVTMMFLFEVVALVESSVTLCLILSTQVCTRNNANSHFIFFTLRNNLGCFFH